MIVRPKLMYLARRHPALTGEQFIPRWRQHGALGMSMPRWKNIWRYVHCDVVDGRDYDGVGIVWHKSPEARRAHREDTSSQAAMEADERETFDRLVVDFCALMEEREALHPRPDAAVKLIRFAQRRYDVTRDRFVEELAPAHARELLHLPDIQGRVRGLVQNHALPSESGRPWGLPYDYVEELWFDTRDDAVAVELMLRKDSPVLLGSDLAVAVLTNEIVLYDASQDASRN